MDSAQDIWSSVLKILSNDLTETAMATWFGDCRATLLTENRLFIHTPSAFKRNVIESRFAGLIRNALIELFAGEFDVVVLDDDGLSAMTQTDEENTYSDVSEYTFDRFVVGSSNKFAHAAALAVADGTHKKGYNPLFIYGDSGLGKTHLLYAIRHAMEQKFPHYNIVYVKGDDFTNELISAIQHGRNVEFREKYRGADLFLMDDIQFIAGRISTQEEFFNTYNTLFELGKQIVFTSDRPPNEITRLEDRLVTRFESGLLADVQPPDFETRMAIIRNKAQELGFALPEDIAQYIAENMSSNVRQLEGAVKMVIAYRDMVGDELTVQSAARHLKDMFKGVKEVLPMVDIIIEETAKYYMLSPEDLKGQSRMRNMATSRQIAMYLIRKLTNLSLKDIGELFEGRDHSTVLSSIRRIEEGLDESGDFRKIIRDITSNVNSRMN